MINFRSSPFFGLAILLLFTCMAADKIPIPAGPWWMFLIPLLLLCAYLTSRSLKPGWQWWATVCLVILVILAGLIRYQVYQQTLFPLPLMNGYPEMQGFVHVEEVLKRKSTNYSLRCKPMLLLASDSTRHLEFTDRFVVVQVRDPQDFVPFPGDTLALKGRVSAITGPLNPYAFDMRTYYKSMGVRHRLQVQASDVTILPTSRNSIRRLTAQWQYHLSSTVLQSMSPAAAQLTNALVWGDRSDMDPAIIEAFSDSGAMHVLSVSGMHVAIIYSMLYLLLGPPGRGTYSRRITRLAFYCLAIMLYMGLTGASPAVVRAGMMIILYLTGKAMGLSTQVWNLLGFAAFLMIWINPHIWNATGFQLSFLAMAGLLLYTRPITRAITFKQIWLHRTWEVISVSVAAQIFILPVLLWQFHQFPLTFIASSLVAMPAGYVIIFGALANIVLSFLQWSIPWLLLDRAAVWFIDCMKWLAQLNPEMHFAMPQLAGIIMLWMAIIFSIAILFRWQTGRNIAYVMGLTFFSVLLHHRIQQWKTDELLIYHTYNGLLADIMMKGHCYTLMDPTISESQAEFAARGYRSHRDIIRRAPLLAYITPLDDSLGYAARGMHFGSVGLFIFRDDADAKPPDSRITHFIVDHAQDATVVLEMILLCQPQITILPAHFRGSVKYALCRQLELHGLPYYDISKEGFYRYAL